MKNWRLSEGCKYLHLHLLNFFFTISFFSHSNSSHISLERWFKATSSMWSPFTGHAKELTASFILLVRRRMRIKNEGRGKESMEAVGNRDLNEEKLDGFGRMWLLTSFYRRCASQPIRHRPDGEDKHSSWMKRERSFGCEREWSECVCVCVFLMHSRARSTSWRRRHFTTSKSSMHPHRVCPLTLAFIYLPTISLCLLFSFKSLILFSVYTLPLLKLSFPSLSLLPFK